MASAAHLDACSLTGFLNFHSERIIDDNVTTKHDKEIFRLEKYAKTVPERLPNEILITLDGLGVKSNLHMKVLENDLTQTGLKATPILVRHKSPRDKQKPSAEDDDTAIGRCHVLHLPQHRVSKDQLAIVMMNLPGFRTAAVKRGAKFDLDANLRAECSRKSKLRKLFENPA